MSPTPFDNRIELRGQLLYRLYGDLRAQITEHVIAPRFFRLTTDQRKALFDEAIAHLETLDVPSLYVSASFGDKTDFAFRNFFQSLGCDTISAVETAFRVRLAELKTIVETIRKPLQSCPIASSSAGHFPQDHPVGLLYWPLLFIRPPDGKLFTWPPSPAFVDRLLSSNGLPKTYHPTVFGGANFTSLEALSGPARMAFEIVHRRGEVGHLQETTVNDPTAGVAAFDSRLIADYGLTAAGWESATYDWFLGAVSGVQCCLPFQEHDSTSAFALLVLCSPVRSFFHRLVWPNGSSKDEPHIAILGRNEDGSSTGRKVTATRWSKGHVIDVRHIRQPDTVADDHFRQFFDELWTTASMTGCDYTAKLLVQQIAEGLRPERPDEPEPSSIRRKTQASEEHRAGQDIPEIVGISPSIQKLKDEIRLFAATDLSVHIIGAPGTGKELVAKALHNMSTRSSKPYITVNCGDLGDNTKSELFGHEKGSFTGHEGKRLGKFRAAEGGTIFLDEVGDLSPDGQKSLLRVLAKGGIEPYGADKAESIDVRVITASWKDLHTEKEAGKFRRDLLERIFPETSEAVIEVPLLRTRKEDIPLLAKHFLKVFCSKNGRTLTFQEEALQQLQEYSWPGNVRELEKYVESVAAKCKQDGEIGTAPVALADMAKARRVNSSTTPSKVASAPTDKSELQTTAVSRQWTEKLKKQETFFESLGAAVQSDPAKWRFEMGNILKDRTDTRLRFEHLFEIDEALEYLKAEFEYHIASKTFTTKTQNGTIKFVNSPSREQGKSQKRYFFKELELFVNPK